MSLFGPRQDDPLLQDDPFAPASDGNDASCPNDTDAAPPERADSVFGRTGASSRGDGSPRHRVVHRSAAKAKDGRLHELNAAFDAGWRLDHVALQSDASEAEENAPSPSTSTACTIEFVLHRLD